MTILFIFTHYTFILFKPTHSSTFFTVFEFHIYIYLLLSCKYTKPLTGLQINLHMFYILI